jgi:hypothetical protein
MTGNECYMGFERRAGDRHGRTLRATDSNNLRTELTRERADDAGSPPGLRLGKNAFGLANSVVDDDQLPIPAKHVIDDRDQRILRAFLKACFSELMTRSVTISPRLSALRLVAVPLSPHTFKTIERPSPTMDSTPSLCLSRHNTRGCV